MMQTPLILKQLNLLFVDDNSSARADIYILLKPMFKDVFLADKVSTALDIYQSKSVDFIISDIDMGEADEDGLDFVEHIRQQNITIPVVLLSAHSTKEYLMRAVNLQINGYITKPLNFEKLYTVFNRVERRLAGRSVTYYLTAGVFYQPLKKLLIVAEDRISLGKKESGLLELLLTAQGRIVSKEEINASVWKNGEMSESALKNVLGELRKKIKNDIIKNQPAQGWYIERRASAPALGHEGE